MNNVLPLLVIVISTFLCFILAYLVIRQSPKSKLNRSLFLFILLTGLWSVLFFISLNVELKYVSNIIFRSSLAVGSLAPTSCLYFLFFFPSESKKKTTLLFRLILLETLIIFGISLFTPLVGKEGFIDRPIYGSLYPIYIGHIILIICIVLFVSYRKYIRSNIYDRMLMKYLFWGFGISGIFIAGNNLILTAILPVNPFEILGIITPLLVFSPLVYVILKHRFLNIRLVFGEIIYFLILSLIPLSIYYILTLTEIKIFGSVFDQEAILWDIVEAPLFTAIFLFSAKIIREFLKRTLIYVEYDPIISRNEFINLSNSELSLEKLVRLFKKNLNSSIKPKLTQILMYDDETARPLFSDSLRFKKDFTYEFLIELNSYSNEEKIYTLSDIIDINAVSKRPYMMLLEDYMRKHSLEVIILVTEKHSFTGLIGLGAKGDNSTYYKNDIDYLLSLKNIFAVAIERSLLYLERINSEIKLQRKVKEATETLRKQKKELLVKYQYEKDMIGIMGHELRTPMTVAKGFIELVIKSAKSGKLDPEDILVKADKVHDSIMKETDIIETMLSTSHVENNKIALQITSTNITELLDYSYNAFEKMAEDKNLALIYNQPSTPIPVIDTDPNRLQEILNNLVSNAVKYTKEGQVTIDVTLKSKNIEISITDTGIGIPQEEIGKLGRKFYRVNQYLDSKDRVRPGGTGLGLYVVKGLIHALKGELRIESEVGKGSKFTVVLPLDGHFKEGEDVIILNKRQDQSDMFAQMGLKK